jgi:hypothetical protein
MLEAKGVEDYAKKLTQDDWGGNLWSGAAG